MARPLAVRPDGIDVERLDPAAPTPRAAEELGRRLAATHAAGAAHFGSPPGDWQGDGFIGPLPLPHKPFDAWGHFYAALRIEPYARRAAASGALSPSGLAAVERVCARLRDGELDDGSAPARLHGDLWSGNVVWTARGAVLVDPAAHGGHPETDLAMLALFGFPHLDRVLEAYDEVAKLADGWPERVALHQLHPLLVHAVLFGSGYGARAGQAALCYA